MELGGHLWAHQIWNARFHAGLRGDSWWVEANRVLTKGQPRTSRAIDSEKTCATEGKNRDTSKGYMGKGKEGRWHIKRCCSFELASWRLSFIRNDGMNHGTRKHLSSTCYMDREADGCTNRSIDHHRWYSIATQCGAAHTFV
jgi:hypothetical protein